jgi:hypothetical protein
MTHRPLPRIWHASAWVCALTLALSACGGGGNDENQTSGGTATLAAAGVTAAPTLSPEATAIQRLNTERGNCGFGTLLPNSLLDQAALNHANYNAYQASLGVLAGHVEAVGQPLFTGVTLFDRALFVG